MSVRVLVVDDSEIVRRVLTKELGADRDIQVVGSARDPLEASEKIEALHPDVLTLDLEMPKMDGLTFLRGLMRHHPMPVVVVSAYTPKGSRLALEALESGAVDIVPKPGMSLNVREMASELTAKVKGAASAKVAGMVPKAGAAAPRKGEIDPSAVEAVRARRAAAIQTPVDVLPPVEKAVPRERVIAIGSSTGGTQALQYLLSRLPANMPPILVVQHMPTGFTKPFAERLNSLSPLQVKEAENRDEVKPGCVLIAKGGRHLILRRSGSRYWAEVVDGPRVQRQIPSVEVLFQSVTKSAGRFALAAILTGMGADGAEGMLALKKEGAVTIAESEESCVVFGMPRAAIELGGVDHVEHLHRIPEMLHRLV